MSSDPNVTYDDAITAYRVAAMNIKTKNEIHVREKQKSADTIARMRIR